MDDPMTLRMLERIVATIIGGLSMYLGYRLFINMPKQRNSDGSFAFPGGIKIILSRVGPGIFFALFGAVIVVASFYFAVTFDGAGGMSGIGPNDTNEIYLETQRKRLEPHMFFLNNTLFSVMDAADLPDDERKEAEGSIRNLKLNIMRLIWDNKIWGDYSAFERAIQLDDFDSAHADAVSYYRHGAP